MCGAGLVMVVVVGGLEPADVLSFQPPLPRTLTLTQFHTHTRTKCKAKGFKQNKAQWMRTNKSLDFIFPRFSTGSGQRARYLTRSPAAGGDGRTSPAACGPDWTLRGAPQPRPNTPTHSTRAHFQSRHVFAEEDLRRKTRAEKNY